MTARRTTSGFAVRTPNAALDELPTLPQPSAQAFWDVVDTFPAKNRPAGLEGLDRAPKSGCGLAKLGSEPGMQGIGYIARFGQLRSRRLRIRERQVPSFADAGR